jgi:hypothetical protein
MKFLLHAAGKMRSPAPAESVEPAPFFSALAQTGWNPVKIGKEIEILLDGQRPVKGKFL